MPLHFAESVLFNAVNFRVVHLWGRYGGGKTALAWYMAYELMLRFKFRYILSNVYSVWADDIADVYLAPNEQGNLTADAILILDEAGTFMKSSAETDEWLSALRKLNIVILCPSFMPPSRTARMLVTQRVFNGHIIGLNFWWYKWTLDMGVLNETGNFYWRNPREIFGIFDTYGFPTHADSILAQVKAWVAEAQASSGYKTEAEAGTTESRIAQIPATKVERLPARVAQNAAKAGRYSASPDVVDVQRAADDILSTTKKAEAALSLFNKRRGR